MAKGKDAMLARTPEPRGDLSRNGIRKQNQTTSVDRNTFTRRGLASRLGPSTSNKREWLI